MAQYRSETWLRFDHPNDEGASHEANVTELPDGRVKVEWSHVSVGQVVTKTFNTREEAERFLSDGGYRNFTS